jgi:hypothetical protein
MPVEEQDGIRRRDAGTPALILPDFSNEIKDRQRLTIGKQQPPRANFNTFVRIGLRAADTFVDQERLSAFSLQLSSSSPQLSALSPQPSALSSSS